MRFLRQDDIGASQGSRPEIVGYKQYLSWPLVQMFPYNQSHKFECTLWLQALL
jgi:hypothetical protein